MNQLSSSHLLPVLTASSTLPVEKTERRLPSWLRRQLPRGNAQHFTDRLIRDLRLETVCENAKCPNRPECYARKTATFMILGNVCTRPCGFCAVQRGRPDSVEDDEAERLTEATLRLGLKHVVITSVTRDDLPDGGAGHFVACIEQLRNRTTATIEILTPDFLGNWEALNTVIDARPDVFNHNTETVPRLYDKVRGKACYRRTLELLRRVKQRNPDIHTKSGLMLGLGETSEEILDVLCDLRDMRCDFLTLGQYLQPSKKHLPVQTYLRPETFDQWGEFSRLLGFSRVASGPFVRSSYHADEMASSSLTDERPLNRDTDPDSALVNIE